MRLSELNALDDSTAAHELLRCCGSTRWARAMAASRPFASTDALYLAADQRWRALGATDILEAFAAHPKIGAGEAGRAGSAAAAEPPGQAGLTGQAVQTGQAGRAGKTRDASEWSQQE